MQKRGIRIAAFDDGPFAKGSRNALVVGVIGRERLVEGILSFSVSIDGDDATRKLVASLKHSRFLEQVKLIAINGITFAGLNVVDTVALYGALRIPVIAVTRKKPHSSLLKNAVRKAGGGGTDKKIKIIDGIAHSSGLLRIHGIYVQQTGTSGALGGDILDNSLELLRLAHLVASGIVRGESKGRL